MAREIDIKTYNRLVDARITLCNYCKADECEYCMVTRLIDDAYVKLSQQVLSTKKCK